MLGTSEYGAVSPFKSPQHTPAPAAEAAPPAVRTGMSNGAKAGVAFGMAATLVATAALLYYSSNGLHSSNLADAICFKPAYLQNLFPPELIQQAGGIDRLLAMGALSVGAVVAAAVGTGYAVSGTGRSPDEEEGEVKASADSGRVVFPEVDLDGEGFFVVNPDLPDNPFA